jgi:hypothetical protein
MKVFIRSAACVSPQKTFETDGFLDKPVEYVGTRLKAIDPDYSKFIDANVSTWPELKCRALLSPVQRLAAWKIR